jgi:circadian clock protein KaiC
MSSEPPPPPPCCVARSSRPRHTARPPTPEQIRAVAKNFGWNLSPLEAEGRLLVSYTSPVELLTDRFLDVALRRIEAVGARRVVLDSLTSMSLGVLSQRRFREMVYALTKHLRAAGVTLLMTMEVAELLGTAQLTGHGVSSTADNLILLRYVEVDGCLDLRRVLTGVPQPARTAAGPVARRSSGKESRRR